MPQNKFALARYQIIDSLLRKKGYVKTLEMAEVCRRKTGFNVSQRTIQLDVDAMKHDSFLGYYAPIEYCPKRKSYYYENGDYFLVPFSFVEEEILTIKDLFENSRANLSDCQCEMIERVILKMRLLKS